MIRRILAAVLLLLPLATAGAMGQTNAAKPEDRPPFKTSFDCAKARSALLQIVCNDRGLAALDIETAALLKRARAKATTPDAVDEEQDLWLSQRAGCRSAGCLTRAYRDRIAQLHAWVD